MRPYVFWTGRAWRSAIRALRPCPERVSDMTSCILSRDDHASRAAHHQRCARVHYSLSRFWRESGDVAAYAAQAAKAAAHASKAMFHLSRAIEG